MQKGIHFIFICFFRVSTLFCETQLAQVPHIQVTVVLHNTFGIGPPYHLDLLVSCAESSHLEGCCFVLSNITIRALGIMPWQFHPFPGTE
jgi:hypothetical protein